MAKRKRKGFGYGPRSREHVERGAWATRRAGRLPQSPGAEKQVGLRAEVKRMNEPGGKRGLYTAWVCLPSRGGSSAARRLQTISYREPGCGEGRGHSPTSALAAAARDFARSIMARENYARKK